MEGAMALNPGADPFQNQALVHMWLEVKLKPLLRSITKQFLSCLSSKNFSCDTYQAVYDFVCCAFSSLCFYLKSLFFSLYLSLYISFSISLSVCVSLLPHPWCKLHTYPYVFLKGEGIEPPLLRDGPSETKVDLHLLHVPFPIWRGSSWYSFHASLILNNNKFTTLLYILIQDELSFLVWLWSCVHCVWSPCRLCKATGEQWGLVNTEFWFLQSNGPYEGLFNTQHSLQWCELNWYFISRFRGFIRLFSL